MDTKKTKLVRAVTWAYATQGDDSTSVKANSGLFGIYHDENTAKQAVDDCAQSFIDQVRSDSSLTPEDLASFEHNLMVFGSADDGFIELEYALDDEPVFIHVQLECVFI